MKTGIYSITNLQNNKKYIGYSTNIKGRWYCHKSHLRKNKHKNIHLQNAWNKYGEKNFLFEILEECKKEKLCEREHYWVTTIKVTNRTIGYNIESTDPKHPMRNPTKEEIIKFKERNNKPVGCEKCGKICNYSNYKKYHGDNCGKKYNQSQEFRQSCSLRNKGRICSKETREKIRIANTGKSHSEETKKKIVANRKKLKHSEETKKKMSESRGKRVYQYDIEGNLLQQFRSVSEAHRITGYGLATIFNHCKSEGKIRNSFLNCRWSYKKLPVINAQVPYKIVMMDMQNNELNKFRSVQEAADYLNKPPGSIYKYLENKGQKSALGYKWKYL